MCTRNFFSTAVMCAAVFSSLFAGAQNAGNRSGVPEVSAALHHDLSAALRDMPAAPRAPDLREKEMHRIPRGLTVNQADPVVQNSTGASVATTSGLSFAGVGYGDYSFFPNAAPPDTNGAVGATQYVQWVNESFAVFNKSTGALVLSPRAGNTLWAGFGGGCETNNDGDPLVQYDKAANRWVMTQFSVSTTPFLQCVAVSQTSDATGAYYRYAFAQPYFNDYPKMGVWPDGYYISFNMFNGNAFAGGRACAFDRSKMLAGQAAMQICFQLSSTYGGLLPSDLDGSTPPPAGSPNPFVAFGNNSASLDIWKFHADFVTPANSSFIHSNISAPAFAAACNGGGACIPQSGTNQVLDSLADRLMHRLAYRNFGDHESLVVNHAVTAGASVGIRWYEIRNPNGAASVYQSGTFAPDATYRWMGSIGMDKVGNIALGYSTSSSTLHPGIRYTGRAPTDPLGMLQAENVILTGGGSQTANLSRWGDYSALTIDPSDDCTFFYTNEYLKASGTFNWSTWIASFKFPSCGSSQPVLTSVSVSPATATVITGGHQQFNATALDQFGQPLTTQPSFSWTVSGGGTISGQGYFTAGSTAGGPYTVTATAGTGPSAVSGTASVTVSGALPDFSLAVSPASKSVKHGGTATYTVTINPISGSSQVTLSLSGQPAGAAVTFTPNPASTTSTLSVKTLGSTRGTYTLSIKGGNGNFIHTIPATLIVTQ